MLSASPKVLDIRALLAGGFREEMARSLYAQGEEIAIFVMLQLAALAVQSGVANTVVHGGVNDIHPSEPSGSVATYLKATGQKRRKKPGAKPGHPGSHRPPKNITHRVRHVARCYPVWRRC